jgi:pimeloyl-ACP methyl ester carboxylesterase
MTRHIRTAGIGLLFLSLFAFLVLIVPATMFAPVPPGWAPEFMTRWAYDVRLALGTPAKSLLSLSRTDFADMRIYSRDDFEPVRFQGNGVMLAGALFRHGTAARRPAIIIVHGSTPAGQRLGLYRVLATVLSNRGYIVLTYDQRGYGDSDDPPRLDQPQAFDYVGDLRRAVDYLTTVDGVDDSRIFVIGHSFGADVAIAAETVEPRLSRIVAFGPVRQFDERVGGQGAPQQAYYLRREIRYMKLSGQLRTDVFLGYRAALSINNSLKQLAGPAHKPLLLIDGELEPGNFRRYLAEFYSAISVPKAYVTLPAADHYANVADLGILVIYDNRAMSRLVETIDTWLISS